MRRQARCFAAASCGCPVLLDPWTVCSDESSITKPNEVIDVYGDGREMYTCQQWNDGLEGVPNDSGTCHGARSAFGVDCDCPIYGDPCTICKGGALMGKLDKEFVVSVGAEAMPGMLAPRCSRVDLLKMLSPLFTNRMTAKVLLESTAAWTGLWVS